jgi:hypothetical protein
VRRLFTHGYLRDEASRLGHPHYNPATMIDTDRAMIKFYHWVADLPQDAADLEAIDHDNRGVANGALSLGRSS